MTVRMPSSGRSRRVQARVAQWLAEVHVASAVPGADRARRRVHCHLRLAPGSKPRRRAGAQRRLQSLERMAHDLVVDLSAIAAKRGLGLLLHAGPQLLELGQSQREILALLAGQLLEADAQRSPELQRRELQAVVVEVQARAQDQLLTKQAVVAGAEHRRKPLLRAQCGGARAAAAEASSAAAVPRRGRR